MSERHPALLSDKAIEDLWYAMQREKPQVRDRKMTTAAARQVVEWLSGAIENGTDYYSDLRFYMPRDKWAALREAVGLSDDDEARRNAEEADMQEEIADSDRAQEAEDSASYERAIGVGREGRR